ncbi:NUDIX hydrolase [bacterium]|nr:MAG: NUDIX hydrolase [bacterium]
MEPKLLPPDVFLHTFTLVPRVAVCLQVRGPRGEILLAQRSPEMETMPGAWHYPGAFLLLGETLEACAERIARKELGASINAQRQVGFFEDLDGDPRGHVIDLVLEVELASPPQATEETGALQFFANVPDNVAFYHDRIMRAAGLT